MRTLCLPNNPAMPESMHHCSLAGGDITEPQSGEVGPKHHHFAITELLQAWVVDNGVLHVIPRGLSSVHPKRSKGVGIFMLGEIA
jgi:hypothetical protein